jgi:chitodextrinase
MFRIEELRENNRAGLLISSFAAHIAAIALVLIMVLGPSTASAVRQDRQRPTTPGNFRVTAKTAYTVSVAWDPSTDNSGNFNYHLSGAYGVPPAVLPKTATSHTFTRLHPGNEYWLFIYARDAAGNNSGSVSATTRTLSDTTPPSTAPVVSVTEVGSTYVSLSWTPAQDDSPFLVYQVWVNGSPYGYPGTSLSTTLRLLEPETTYTFNVRARDEGNNWSPLSDPVTVTTLPLNPNDTTPPTTPTNLREEHYAGSDTEIHLWWTQSTDDFDPQANIRYDVYVNGVLQDIQFGSGGMSIVYGEQGENLIEVIASDTAGNASAPATIEIFF